MAANNEFISCSDPDADQIMKIIDGSRKFQLMLQASKLGIFECLENPQLASTIAGRHEYLVPPLVRFLDALVAMGLLCKSFSDDGVSSLYKNSPASSKYLLMSKRPSFVWMAMMESEMVLPSLSKLHEFLKYGTKSTNPTGGNSPTGKAATASHVSADMERMTINKNNKNVNQDYDDIINQNVEQNMKKQEEFHSMFLLAVEGLAGQSSNNLATTFDLSEFQSAVDLGGGSGLVASQLAATYPEMDVISLDLPHTIALAKKLSGGDTDAITFMSGDFFECDIPQADLYVMVHVLHGFNEERCKKLLKRTYKSLTPGGAILIGEKFLDETRDGPEFCVLNDLTMALIAQEGKERTANEYTSLLTECGFRNTHAKRVSGYNYCDVMMARKPIKS